MGLKWVLSRAALPGASATYTTNNTARALRMLNGTEVAVVWLHAQNGTPVAPGVPCRSGIPLVHCRPPQGTASGAAPILYAHGNAEDVGNVLSWCRWLAQRFRRHVFVFDYEGYGINTKRCATEETIYNNIASVTAYLHRVKGFHKLVLYGRSVGTAPALHEAARNGAGICGVVLQSAFRSAVTTYLPSRCSVPSWCDILMNERTMTRCTVPVMLVHGTEDAVVPFSHACALAEQACVWGHCWLAGAGHNDIDTTPAYRDEMCTAIDHFLASVDPTPTTPMLTGAYHGRCLRQRRHGD